MEITTAQMYWLMTMDSIVNASTGIGVVLSVVALLVFMMAPPAVDFEWNKVKSIAIKALLPIGCCAVFFFGVAAFTPTTKQLAAIIVVPKIINNERIQELPDRVLDLGLEWIEELRPERPESTQ